MREILEGIHCWSRLSQPHGYDFNGYFLTLPSGNLVIDPVEPEDGDLKRLVSEGVSEILLTNRNHSRAANRIREATKAKTLIHAEDARHARSQGCEIDGELTPGSRVGPLHVLPAPGKSPGEVVLYWRERRLAFIGDLVIGNPPGRCSLLPDEKMDDPARLRASVKTLLELELDCLIMGDGVSITQNAKPVLQDLVSGFTA
ncbi:MBL fold metallo-hydrolase [Denitrobaculum tricleocarpae]|nr:MBL fold metallo-hydrolase [Denitrobaculum tricleocarpae]